MEPKKEFLAWLEEAHPEWDLTHEQKEFFATKAAERPRMWRGGGGYLRPSSLWLALTRKYREEVVKK